MSAPVLPRGLYALCDDGVRPDVSLEQKATWLLEGGAQTLQVRIKRTPVRRALEALRTLVVLCEARGALCLVNDRVDWALLTGAHGAHLGDEDLPPEDARQLLGPSKLIGVTVRHLAGARLAAEQGADYVGLGPLFATQTKSVAVAPLGLGALAEIAAQSPLPVVGIAGVTLANIEDVARAGAHAAAVVSDVLCAEDVPARARALQAAFNRGRGVASGT